MAAGGATLMRFFGGLPWTLVGVAACTAGILVGLVGAVRYARVRRELAEDPARPTGC